eukprot:TRINITY_DN13842_c1_g1_i1.p1 TRINITY_DN13842_c1_g1~~TRINITY_DN13842_c1_g1_i1.p1  ORF type:complete len:136 (-),score=16.22 TRINITY_DN13842_c1_g1_i1:231-638(-)
MQDASFGFGRFNQGGFGGEQTHVNRRVDVGNDSPTSRSQEALPMVLPSVTRITHVDGFPAPPMAPRNDEYYKPPRYFGNGFYPPRHALAGENLLMGPRGLEAPHQNAQAGPPGWRDYNPEFRGRQTGGGYYNAYG